MTTSIFGAYTKHVPLYGVYMVWIVFLESSFWWRKDPTPTLLKMSSMSTVFAKYSLSLLVICFFLKAVLLQKRMDGDIKVLLGVLENEDDTTVFPAWKSPMRCQLITVKPARQTTALTNFNEKQFDILLFIETTAMEYVQT